MSQVTVRSFEEIVRGVREQIEIACFSELERDSAEEIALIIAEIYGLPSDSSVRIDGQSMTCGMVSEVYKRLTCEHIREVMRRFYRASYPIKHRKTYLRTSLYNEVFEHESGIANGVACALS